MAINGSKMSQETGAPLNSLVQSVKIDIIGNLIEIVKECNCHYGRRKQKYMHAGRVRKLFPCSNMQQ